MKRIFLIGLLFYLISCGSDDDNVGPDSGDNFDRQSMLINWADNIIIPIYEDLDGQMNQLLSAKDNFIAGPDQSSLENLREAWFSAYKIWQHAEMFHIGKAEELNYRFQMNVYPTSESDIQNNIQRGTYDLEHPNNNDAVGFPALDYLIHGLDADDSELLTYYISKQEATSYKTYISDLVDQMGSMTSKVLEDWKTGFRDQFVSQSSNTATSSVNEQTNHFIQYYEKVFRANKIGIPAGVFSNKPLPEKVEAFYRKDVSKALAQEAFNAIRDFFIGKSYKFNEQGSSYDDYLIFLNTIRNGENLSALINNQLNMAEVKINALDNDFYQQIRSNNVRMLETYDEVQKAVVLLKVDMLQAFDIRVDFVDADGD